MDAQYLEQSATELLVKFKLSTSINYWELKLLKELLALRDAEILAKFHIDKENLILDTLPPVCNKEQVTLTDNSLNEED